MCKIYISDKGFVSRMYLKNSTMKKADLFVEKKKVLKVLKGNFTKDDI